MTAMHLKISPFLHPALMVSCAKTDDLGKTYPLP